MSEISVSSGQSIYPNGINDSGTVVGTLTEGSSGWAFVYTSAGGVQTLGTLPGMTGSAAGGINNSGQIVGRYDTSSFRRREFLYTSSAGMQDLNSLIDPSSGWTLQDAYDINDSGVIVGDGIDPSGYTEAYELIPIPEPATMGLLALGGLAMLRRSR